MKKSIWLTSVLIITALCSMAENNTDYILRKGIQKEKHMIKELSKKMDDLEKEQKEWQSSYKRRVLDKIQEKQSLKSDFYELKKIKKLKSIKLFTLKNRILSDEKKFSKIDLILKELLDNEKNSTKNSIPPIFYGKKQKSFYLRLATDLSNRAYKTEELCDRYLSVIYKDLLEGFDSGTFQDESYYYLRLGKVYFARASLEKNSAQVFGKRKNSWGWIPVKNSLHVKSIIDGIKIIQGKKSPEHIKLPVPLSVISKGGRK